MRAVVYARYSSDQQRDASIEDQVELCRRYAAAQGWQVVDLFADRAMSGSSAFRPEYQRLLFAAEQRRFEIVLTESLDRLGRRLADVADLHDRLSFQGIRLFAATSGEITPMHTAVMGLVAQQFIDDLRTKTRRGQLGRARKGRIPGGLAYGYRVGPADGDGDGARRIEESEAAVVRRIFRLFADGESPRHIARRLNAEGVPGPGGRPWQDTTIRGQPDRGTGLLNNAIYVGRLEWNRCSYVKDPRTGRRLARPNPPGQWEVVEVPELRLVDDGLWERARARQQATHRLMGRTEDGQALNRAHRRKFLLSGLLVCRECGGGYTIMGKDRYGCAAHRSKGTCGNDRTIGRHEIEARVWTALRERLMAPELVDAFTTAFEEEANRLVRERASDRRTADTRLDRVQAKIGRLIEAIEEGLYEPSMKQRLADLEAEKRALGATMAEAARPTVYLPPNLPGLYARKVAELESLLADPEEASAAMEAVRSMIERIEVGPAAAGGVDARLYGDLAEIVALCEGRRGYDDAPRREPAGRGRVSVVAGAHNWLGLFFWRVAP